MQSEMTFTHTIYIITQVRRVPRNHITCKELLHFTNKITVETR